MPSLAALPDAFTTLWTGRRCGELERAGDAGCPLGVLFGGPHLSLPSLTRAGVAKDSRVFPILVRDGRLHVLGRLHVRDVVPFAAYLAVEFGETGIEGADGRATRDRLLADHPGAGHRLPPLGACVTEAVLGAGTPLRFDAYVPPDRLTEVRFVSRRGERPIRHLENGAVAHASSLQGVYRITPATEALLSAALDPAFDPGPVRNRSPQRSLYD